MAIHFLILKMLWSMSCLLDPKTFLLEIIFPNLASHIQGFWVKNVWKVSNSTNFLSLIFPSETYEGHQIHASYGHYSMSRRKGSWKFISTTYLYSTTNLCVVLRIFWAIYKWPFKKYTINMKMLPNIVSVLFFLQPRLLVTL